MTTIVLLQEVCKLVAEIHWIAFHRIPFRSKWFELFLCQRIYYNTIEGSECVWFEAEVFSQMMPHINIFQQYLAKMSDKCKLSPKHRSSSARCQRSKSARALSDLHKLATEGLAKDNPNRLSVPDCDLPNVPDVGQGAGELLWTRSDASKRPVAKVKSNSFGALDRSKPLFRQGDGIRWGSEYNV